MRIAVCDDSRVILSKEKTYISEYRPEDEVRGYTDPDTLMREISDYKPDVVFMDIDLNKKNNGIDYAMKINELLPDIFIVFVSQYGEYAVDAHRAEHIYYVLKEDMYEKFASVFERIEKKMHAEKKSEEGFFITTLYSRDRTFVKHKDILYLATAQRHTEVHTVHETYVSNTKIDELLEEIKSADIVRCHQSFAVNLANIANYSREELMMKDGAYVPISRKYIASVRDAFVNYAEKLI